MGVTLGRKIETSPLKVVHKKKRTPTLSGGGSGLSCERPPVAGAPSPRGGGAGADQQRPKDLAQGAGVQAVVGLGLGHLGQVGEEELQGEPVVEGHAGGRLQHQAHLSAMAAGHRAVCEAHQQHSEEE